MKHTISCGWESGLAGCTGIDVVLILKKMKFKKACEMDYRIEYID